jgi:hypothetical protein
MSSSITRVKKVAVTGNHSMAYFIQRARVQKLYRNFLRVCQTDEERLQVRAEFKTNRMGDAATLKEVEVILKQLQLARGFKPTQTAFTKAGEKQLKAGKQLSIFISKPSAAPASLANGDEEEPPSKVEWPWQRKDNKLH